MKKKKKKMQFTVAVMILMCQVQPSVYLSVFD